ncbi:Propionyl-coenzyme A carboxylase alpha polypeptide [Shinella sp. WSC3-e]|nr:conserved hypothetical protein [Rhizobiaceae bacterium]CAK7256646.1 Propionyl-coenzyme A carboxylase alpha polypeptide [Shinella sp. WSC3-e]
MYSVFLSLEFAAALPPSALPGISPTSGEIGKWQKLCSHATFVMGEASPHPVSPLVGEMPGRAEGGAKASDTRGAPAC